MELGLRIIGSVSKKEVRRRYFECRNKSQRVQKTRYVDAMCKLSAESINAVGDAPAIAKIAAAMKESAEVW